MTWRIIRTKSSIFCYLIDINISKQNLPVCNSGQHTYIMNVFNFFFVLQDLIDRINPYFKGIAFRRKLLLIGFQHTNLQAFSNVNKQPSLEWHCVNWTEEIVAESGQWVSNIKIYILLKKGWFSLEYPWNKKNNTFTWLSSLYNPFKENIQPRWKTFAFCFLVCLFLTWTYIKNMFVLFPP